MPRSITNKSNYWSQHHEGMLVVLANQLYKKFNGRIEVTEFINIGWLNQARYYESVKNKAKGIQREMYNWARKEMAKRLPSVDDISNESNIRQIW